MNEIIERLTNIPNHYRPIPFWSWNDDLDEGELVQQIQWMYENGIGGFIMHARGGLKTPYLSEDWMRKVNLCCQEAQKFGMEAWVYDENGWPSGFVGGKLLNDPNNRDMYISATVGVFDPSADLTYSFTGQSLTRVDSAESGLEYLNLYLRKSASTVDILNPNVTKQFLEETHQRYQSYFSERLSSSVSGFFTDEPQYYRWGTSYSPMLVSYFRDHYEEDIFDKLGLLFVEKEGYRQFRYRYWLAMQSLMIENFASPVYEWCNTHGLRLTGHYVEELSLGAQLTCCAGIMPFYEYEHMPGIDWLGRDTPNALSPRQLTSVACQLGKKQRLTESFGCCGWNVSLAELNRILGFQYANGVNRLCHHLVSYSEHGQRKKDHPPHFNRLNPWIDDHFKTFNDRASKLGYLLTESVEPVNVAILHPIRSAYLEYKRENENSGYGVSDLDNGLKDACNLFSSYGIAYHFLDETLLEKYGYVEHEKIGCGECAYEFLVIPHILTVGKETEKLLHQFIINGGKVLLLDAKPAYLEGGLYDFDYLVSTCTMDDIISAQPFSVENKETELHCTYRKMGDQSILFVQNTSPQKDYTQTFSFKDDIVSFESLDLVTHELNLLPLTVTLKKNESLLLFPSRKLASEKKSFGTLSVCLKDAKVSFENNYMPLDCVQYSKDGVNFSNSMLCMDLFKQLLKEQYEGQLHVRYPFEMRYLPESLKLVVEKGNFTAIYVNGKEIEFLETLFSERSMMLADISQYIKIGNNECELALNWHQSEETYYALFGENVTESLKNCIAYDSEIEPIYLVGYFGVYSRLPMRIVNEEFVLGGEFYIGVPPKVANDLVRDGFPFFRGKLTLSQQIQVDDTAVVLSLPGEYLHAKVHVNGAVVGDLLFENTIDISEVAQKGINDLKVDFAIGNRNLLGPLHTCMSEQYVSPQMFEQTDLPTTENGSIQYKLRSIKFVN